MSGAASTLAMTQKKVKGKQGLGKSIGHSLFGQIYYLATQMGVISALAHFKGAAAVGEFGLAMAVATPIYMMSNMGLRTIQSVDVHRDYSFSEYAGVRLLSTLAAIPATLIGGYFFATTSTAFLIVVLVAFTKAFESISDLAYGAFQQNARMDLVARSLILRGTFTLPLFVGMLFLGFSTSSALFAQLITWGLASCLLDYPSAYRITGESSFWPRIAGQRSVALVRQSAPLGGGALATALQMSTPRFFLDRMVSLEAVGIYTTMGYMQQAGLVAANAISFAVLHRFGTLRKSGQYAALRKIAILLTLGLLAVSTVGFVILEFYGSTLLQIAFGKAYASATGILMLVYVSLCVRVLTVVPLGINYADGRYDDLFVLQIVLTVLGVPLSYWLIGRYGLLGAGYVLIILAVIRGAATMALTFRTSAHKTQPPAAEP